MLSLTVAQNLDVAFGFAELAFFLAAIAGVVALLMWWRRAAVRRRQQRWVQSMYDRDFELEHEERTWVNDWRLQRASPPLSFERWYLTIDEMHWDVGRLVSLLGYRHEKIGWRLDTDGEERFGVTYVADLRAFAQAARGGSFRGADQEEAAEVV